MNHQRRARRYNGGKHRATIQWTEQLETDGNGHGQRSFKPERTTVARSKQSKSS